MIWPDIFTDEASIATHDPRSLCAAGLIAWANCQSGHAPPESFGRVLVQIRSRLGMDDAPTAEGLTKHATRQGWLNNTQPARP